MYKFPISTNTSNKNEEEREKMNHKLAVGIILALIFIVCIGIGNYIYKINELSNTKTEQITEVASEKITDECTEETKEFALVNAAEKKVSPNAIFIFKIVYAKCGHTIKQYDKVPEAMVNKTENEIKEIYNDWEIEGFSNSEIVLKKKQDGICDEHYILREEEEQIVIYQLDEDNNEKVFERTGIITKYLPEEDRENIKKGVFVYGKEALNKLLEDFE